MPFARFRWFWPMLVVMFCLGFIEKTFATPQSQAKVVSAKLESISKPPFVGWSLSAAFEVDLGNKLREAVEHGLPLQFAVDFRLERPRWYWTDEEVVTNSYSFSLSYHALTRTYRLITPEQTQIFPRLDGAIQAMTELQQWLVVPKDKVDLGQKYRAQVRFRLALTEMPKPFQVSALANTEWNLGTDWSFFEFIPQAGVLP